MKIQVLVKFFRLYTYLDCLNNGATSPGASEGEHNASEALTAVAEASKAAAAQVDAATAPIWPFMQLFLQRLLQLCLINNFD